MIWAEGRLAFRVPIKEYLVINHAPRIPNHAPATIESDRPFDTG